MGYLQGFVGYKKYLRRQGRRQGDVSPKTGGRFPCLPCTDNEMIDEDIVLFSQALSKDDELISERRFVLARLLKEMGC
jgi:hypothetical protein